MSTASTLNRFSHKSGDLHHYNLRLKRLSPEKLRIAVALVDNGIDPKEAIDRAKNGGFCEMCGSDVAQDATRCAVCERVFSARKGTANGGRI